MGSRDQKEEEEEVFIFQKFSSEKEEKTEKK